MNWLDLVIVAFIGFLTFRAYRNGFIRELVSLSSVVIGIPLAGALYDDLYPKVHPIVDNVMLANLVSFLAIFAGVVIGGQVAAHLLKQGARLLNLGMADALAGGLFGFLKGAGIAQTVCLALVIFPSPDLRSTIDRSVVARGLLDATPLVLAVLPPRFESSASDFLSDFGKSAGEDAVPTAAPSGTR